MADAPRQKSLRKRLQRQLEFYLSESNLRQDKFLRQNMDERGFVPARLFLSFNKLKALKATERMVLEAADKSSLIRADHPGASIAPIELPTTDTSHEADASTIYIESFGADDDHDSLRKMFSQFGKVNLVSMPRFQQSRKFKGFAFVEFAGPDAAETAVKAAAARVPSLNGIRAMSKLRWLSLKEQLKAKLLEAEAGASHRDTKLSTSPTQESTVSNGGAGARATEPDESQAPPRISTQAAHKKKKRSTHIHFGSSGSEDEDEGATDARDTIKKTRIE